MGQDHTGIPGQGTEQLVFGAAELYGAILKEYQMLGIIKREVTSGEDNLAGCLLARRRLAAQKGTDTRQQLFHTKRFRDKVIGSKVKQPHTFVFLTPFIQP